MLGIFQQTADGLWTQLQTSLKASNTTDAVSQVLYLEARDATDWVDAAPLASDRAVWVAST